MLAGDSTTNEAATFLANRALKALVADRMTFETRARMGALLGAARLSSGNSDPVQSLEPLYVRPPDARAGMPGRAVSLQEGLWSAERKNSSGCI